MCLYFDMERNFILIKKFILPIFVNSHTGPTRFDKNVERYANWYPIFKKRSRGAEIHSWLVRMIFRRNAANMNSIPTWLPFVEIILFDPVPVPGVFLTINFSDCKSLVSRVFVTPADDEVCKIVTSYVMNSRWMPRVSDLFCLINHSMEFRMTRLKLTCSFIRFTAWKTWYHVLPPGEWFPPDRVKHWK